MHHQDRRTRKHLSANVTETQFATDRRSARGVQPLVFDEVAAEAEVLRTDIASKRFVSSMCACVTDQRTLLSERHVTDTARERLHVGVYQLVLPQVTPVAERPQADVTLQTFPIAARRFQIWNLDFGVGNHLAVCSGVVVMFEIIYWIPNTSIHLVTPYFETPRLSDYPVTHAGCVLGNVHL